MVWLVGCVSMAKPVATVMDTGAEVLLRPKLLEATAVST